MQPCCDTCDLFAPDLRDPMQTEPRTFVLPVIVFALELKGMMQTGL